MRWVWVAVLALLSPWLAEYVAFGTADRLGLIVFLAPMYGSGALLVREAARRRRNPWLVVALLGVGYGIAEAGLIDMSLFNPDYGESGTDYTAITPVPGLDAGAYSILSFVLGHAIWSIATPIALVEGLAGPELCRRPWLGRPGLVVCGLLYLGGAALIHTDVADDFTPSAAQVGFSVAVLVLALLGAWYAARRPTPVGDRPLRPWLVGLSSFALASAWCLLPESWAGVAGQVVLLGVVAGLGVVVRRFRWTALDALAAAAGPLLTYLWVALAYPVADYPGDHANPAFERQSEVIFSAVAVGLLVLSAQRSQRRVERL